MPGRKNTGKNNAPPRRSTRVPQPRRVWTPKPDRQPTRRVTRANTQRIAQNYRTIDQWQALIQEYERREERERFAEFGNQAMPSTSRWEDPIARVMAVPTPEAAFRPLVEEPAVQPAGHEHIKKRWMRQLKLHPKKAEAQQSATVEQYQPVLQPLSIGQHNMEVVIRQKPQQTATVEQYQPVPQHPSVGQQIMEVEIREEPQPTLKDDEYELICISSDDEDTKPQMAAAEDEIAPQVPEFGQYIANEEAAEDETAPQVPEFGHNITDEEMMSDRQLMMPSPAAAEVTYDTDAPVIPNSEPEFVRLRNRFNQSYMAARATPQPQLQTTQTEPLDLSCIQSTVQVPAQARANVQSRIQPQRRSSVRDKRPRQTRVETRTSLEAGNTVRPQPEVRRGTMRPVPPRQPPTTSNRTPNRAMRPSGSTTASGRVSTARNRTSQQRPLTRQQQQEKEDHHRDRKAKKRRTLKHTRLFKSSLGCCTYLGCRRTACRDKRYLLARARRCHQMEEQAAHSFPGQQQCSKNGNALQ